jgi:hypothetical protein
MLWTAVYIGIYILAVLVFEAISYALNEIKFPELPPAHFVLMLIWPVYIPVLGAAMLWPKPFQPLIQWWRDGIKGN